MIRTAIGIPIKDDDYCDITTGENILTGLARECPKCHVVDHYNVYGRKPKEVKCLCGHRFIVHKYKRGERPKAKIILFN